jgi:hypothetical protein
MASTMDLSQPLIRRGPLLATGMVVVLAGFGQAAAAQTVNNKGTLELQFGTSASNVVLKLPDGSGASQALRPLRRNDCRLSSASTTGLLDFSATNQGSAAPVGLVSGSMGVYSGSSGTPCGRFDANLNQTLTVALGQTTQDKVGDNTVFYRLELDIETKKSLSVDLEVLVADGSGGFAVFDTYTLRSGSSVIAGQGSIEPGSKIFNCNAQSDSGPDAGALDNCRWEIDALGHGFRLRPTAGEGSLEGGSDTGIFSKIFLTEAVIGVLGCGVESTVPLGEDTTTIGDGQQTAQCTVTRIDPSEVGGTCEEPVSYIFRNLGGGTEGCDLTKPEGEQLAASIKIKFPPEITAPLGAEELTQIAFSDGNGGSVPFTPERCIGTVVADPNGNLTIAEVLQGTLYIGMEPLTDANDAVPGNGSIDWACILDNAQDYLGPPEEGAEEQMQVKQTILFWGDISFSRN